MANDLLALGYYDDDQMAGDDDMGLGYDDDGDVVGWNPISGIFQKLIGRKQPKRRAAPMGRRLPFSGTPARGTIQPIGSAYQQFAQLLAPPPGGAGMLTPGVRETVISPIEGVVSFAPAGLTSATFTFTPYKRCKPTRLIATAAIVGAPGVEVVATSAMIGDRNQFGGSGNVVVNAAFRPDTTYSNINWDVIDPSVPLKIAVVLTGVVPAMTSIAQSFTLFATNLN